LYTSECNIRKEAPNLCSLAAGANVCFCDACSEMLNLLEKLGGYIVFWRKAKKVPELQSLIKKYRKARRRATGKSICPVKLLLEMQ